MNQNVFIVDRLDEVKWHLDESSPSMEMKIKHKHHILKKHIQSFTNATVVISGQGICPRPGTEDHHSLGYRGVQRDLYRIYFEDPDDFAIFKLSIDLEEYK